MPNGQICDMIRNSKVTAPQLADVDAAYRLWHETHLGSTKDFYAFMTTPSRARAMFMAGSGLETDFVGSVARTYCGTAK